MHKITPYIGYSFLVLWFILTGCNAQQAGNQKPSLTYADFVHKLQQKGVSITTTQPFNVFLFSGTAHGLLLENEPITVFEYANDDTMQADASTISSDGSTLHHQNGSASVMDWIAPPHLFKTGHIIVFYIGKNHSITSLLQSLLGAQFAGL